MKRNQCYRSAFNAKGTPGEISCAIEILREKDFRDHFQGSRRVLGIVITRSLYMKERVREGLEAEVEEEEGKSR